MQKISMIKAELLDQYVKCMDGIQSYRHAIEHDCIKGYISRKIINGKEQFYLQWNDNGKVKSKYIHSEDIEIIKKNIAIRKKYESNIKEMKCSLKEIEKFVGKKLLNEYLAERMGENENVY